jgi:hypothetical protein
MPGSDRVWRRDAARPARAPAVGILGRTFVRDLMEADHVRP